MVETKGYVPEDYEKFRSISPEDADEEIIEKRNESATRIKESILAIKNFRGRFRSKSEIGAFIINNSLKAMQGRVGEADVRWVNEVKDIYMKLSGAGEASWSGVLGEFTAARIIERSGNTARFPGNIPDGMEKPSGYNEYTQAEQDRLQGIDWWLDKKNDDGTTSPYAVTVKTMPFTPNGAGNNRFVYDISEGYEERLKSIINDESIESKDGAETPLERYNKTIEACGKARVAGDEYGTGALLMIVPSLGNDSNINRHTGEPSSEITEIFGESMSQIMDSGGGEIGYETIDKAV